MKSAIAKTSLLIIACTTLGAAIAAGPPARAPRLNLAECTTIVTPLTADETEVLRWMREEEKLARDIYLGLYDRWQSPLFKAIAASEQRHFDAIGAKLTLFAVADPVQPSAGHFASEDLQATYNQLMTSGSGSYIQALMAGATVEEADMRDLQAAIEATQNPALQITYGNLLEGTKNHLRAFVARLRDLGIEYTPTLIDPVLFDAIIDF